jgi:hypothetical protein
LNKEVTYLVGVPCRLLALRKGHQLHEFCARIGDAKARVEVKPASGDISLHLRIAEKVFIRRYAESAGRKEPSIIGAWGEPCLGMAPNEFTNIPT